MKSDKTVNEAYILGILDGRDHMQFHIRIFGAPMTLEDMQDAYENARDTLKTLRLADDVAAHTRGFRDFFKNQIKVKKATS